MPQPRTGLLEPLGGFLVELSVWTAAPHGEAILDRLCGNIESGPQESGQVLHRLREATTIGETIGHDVNAAVRARAIQVFERLLGAALDAFDQVVSEARTQDGSLDLTPERAEVLRNITEVIDTATAETYFASGSYIDPSDNPEPRLAEPKRRRFYQEAGGLLDLLVRVASPARAVHHVLETLHEQVSFDPRGVLLRVGTLVLSARDWGYQNDSLAQRTFVEIVQIYLAEYRSLLADSQARQALLDSLDAFVDAGWPGARRLVYRLDEAFR